MKGMNATQRKDFVDKKAKEREAVQTKIREVNENREKYIADERKKTAGSSKNTLDEAMLGAVREQATKKNYKFEK